MPRPVFAFLLLILFSSVSYSQNRVSIPLGGNSWLRTSAVNGKEEVTNEGWSNWENTKAEWSVYFRVAHPGSLSAYLVLNVPEGASTLECSIGDKVKTISVSGSEEKNYKVGDWQIGDSGYVRIDMKGLAKSGKVYANVKGLYIEGTAVDERTTFVKNNDDNYFYWGRRGPSVHINYDLSAVTEDIEWFYNEITVRKGNDVIGSYFMANGFAEGYFGMQVNSSTERRILFSVWSPFKTDDPKQIPEDQKIRMVKKGESVYSGEFGNEGSGGQSILKYNWKAGLAYKFLLRAKPVENNYTNYTAWFYATDERKWKLIASFDRPATHTYLKRLHSFLENFEPATGYITRKAWYHDQWVRTISGKWIALNSMTFSADATARKGYRMDYMGGEDRKWFFLRNCGFFNETTPFRSIFKVQTPAKIPEIDIVNFEKAEH